MAEVDARVDAMVTGVPELDLTGLRALAASLDDAPDAQRPGLGGPPPRRGPVTWAFDGATALGLHGLAVDSGFGIGLVVVLDEALRFWLRAVQVRGQTPRGDVFMGWLDADLETLQAALRDWSFCLLGPVQIRVVEQLPAIIQVVPPGLEQAVPVVTVDDVERCHPVHAEVLARWRQRRTVGA
ncbi:MAG: hypothetical protein JWM02_1361 [Frankiales bacterium]|nr:hypothetical protein [Frankiales bacterium]